MIAVDAHTPLARVRKKLEETFGQFDLTEARDLESEQAEEDLVAKLARGMREHRLVEIEYQKEVDTQPSTRLVEPYTFERALPYWYVHTWDRTSGGERSFRLDRMRSAQLTKEKFSRATTSSPRCCAASRSVRVLYEKEIARFEIERGARRLTDGTALRELPVGSDEWLVSDILSKRGRAIVLEPAELRARVAARARSLAKELGVERLRVKV